MKLPRFFVSFLIWLGLLRRPQFLCVDVADEPRLADLVAGKVFREVRGGYAKWAHLKCPKCGEMISLGISNKGPWKLEVDWLGRPDINPSIWQTGSCGAHFFIRSGRIDWC